MPDPKGFGLRDDMMRRALSFRSDLNTMGFDYPYSAHDISADDEIKELDRRTGYPNMRRLPKRHEITWWNGAAKYAPGSMLDHVVAADHLKFKKFAAGSEVDVRGWPDEPTEAKQKAWIKKYSDHALLYFQVEKA